MPVKSVTTTAEDVFFGDHRLDSINFKNGSSSGTIYLRNKQVKQNAVSSTDYEWSLPVGSAIGLTRSADGDGIIGPWQAISDTGGGVTLEILPVYRGALRRQ
jgi:hypothetical protein